jgi:uncharacterized protein YndB with AHSA1/START domain
MARAERELTMTRVFDAPRALVYKAWTDPKHMSRWFGPKVFTTPVCELDVRPGGAWKIVMRGPDGSEFPGGGVYREIIPRERLAFTNNALDKSGNVLLEGFTTVTFEDENGGTKLTMHTRATALAQVAEAMLQGMEQGWAQTLDKLGDELTARRTAVSRPSDRELVYTRVFDAPRELVFKVWTDPKHIVEWWGPIGFRTENIEMDARVGGEWRLVMHGPDGRDYKNRIAYREVVPPERLVYHHGGDGSSVRFEVTVTFEEEDGGTRLTMRQMFESGAERDHIVQTYGADKGGVQTLERLAEHLSTIV